MAQENSDMVPVPIPTEVPEPPRLDQLPLDILHSATVELLIQQNEDLSSRLKVNIRRNSQLEMKILESDKEIKDLNRHKENLRAQIEILKEKQALWEGKKLQTLAELKSRSDEVEMLELRYNELYATSQGKSKEQRSMILAKQNEINKLNRKLEVIQKVRSRAKRKLRLFLIEMAEGFHLQQKTAKKSESSHRLVSRHFESLKNEVIEKEQIFYQQLQNLKDSSQKALESLDLKLVEQVEKNNSLVASKQDLQKEIQDLQAKLHEEKKLRIKLSEMTKEISRLKNDKIEFKSAMQSAVNLSEQARTNEANKFKDLQEKHNQLQKDFELQKDTLSSCEGKLLKISKDNREMSQQLESVQSLWVDTQEKLEKAELRLKSLEKLNKQLSKNSKQDKRERAIERAQPTEKTPSTTDNEDMHSRIKDAFASQYRTLARGPEMDL